MGTLADVKTGFANRATAYDSLKSFGDSVVAIINTFEDAQVKDAAAAATASSALNDKLTELGGLALPGIANFDAVKADAVNDINTALNDIAIIENANGQQ